MYIKYGTNFKMNIINYASRYGIRSASRIFGLDRNTIRRWVRDYNLAIGKAMGKLPADFGYGRSAREACLLTQEQREKWCKPENCKQWHNCRVRVNDIYQMRIWK
ncbi:MAG: helix-turn-helix domain-containing protein [Planctomycetes bacterium]|nr:helix-turn-helix domain-containing protein [Planctomycetota bacterium]